MITQMHSEKLAVISDLHLGNPFSFAKRKTIRFIEWASNEGFDICINGDGFEIAQVSFAKLASDVPDVLQALKHAMKKGVKIYYVVGNHDIVFEHFLNDWGGFKMAPFLNVYSSERRFRVEHGHLYDPFFVRYPRFYEFSTWLAGFFLKVHPSLYRLWILFERVQSVLRGPVQGTHGILGEAPHFQRAAAEIEARGFDGIVFGHTHHAGSVQLPGGGVYFNPGSWMITSHYVKIEKGIVSLCEFVEVCDG